MDLWGGEWFQNPEVIFSSSSVIGWMFNFLVPYGFKCHKAWLVKAAPARVRCWYHSKQKDHISQFTWLEKFMVGKTTMANRKIHKINQNSTKCARGVMSVKARRHTKRWYVFKLTLATWSRPLVSMETPQSLRLHDTQENQIIALVRRWLENWIECKHASLTKIVCPPEQTNKLLRVCV